MKVEGSFKVGTLSRNRITWINIWDEIFKSGAPTDLINPYSKFNIVLDKVLESKSKKVLDVAMGAGRHSMIMASSGLDVYAFDLSEEAIKISKSEANKRNLDIEILKADMFNTYPYKDNSFDAVIAIQAIYHGYKKHMLKAIREVHRVLKAGGDQS